MKVEEFTDPYLGKTWQELGARILASGNRISVTLGYPASGLEAELQEQLAGFLGVSDVDLELRFSADHGRAFNQVKNIVLVASGKGGVGKSTVAVNLAFALQNLGLKIGILDADIYGPSLPKLFSIKEKPENREGKLIPVSKYDIQCMSMGFLTDEQTPMIWRGPMVTSAIKTFTQKVNWKNLDFIIVDMPPGTVSYTHLTLPTKRIV